MADPLGGAEALRRIYDPDVVVPHQPRQSSTRETNVARRAIRVRFGLVEDDPETSCDELLLHSGLVPGGARPEDMDLPQLRSVLRMRRVGAFEGQQRFSGRS